MSEVWQCPDCAEEVEQSVTVCPYCGYAAGTRASAEAAAAASSPEASPGTAATSTAAATRTVRYGHCPSCQRSEWEGAPGRCVTCGAELVQLTAVEIPVEAGGSAHTAVSAVKPVPADASSQATTSELAAIAKQAPSGKKAASEHVVTPARVSTSEHAGAAVTAEPRAQKPSPAASTQQKPELVDAADATSTAHGSDGIRILRELAALRDDGIITAEEFEAKKAEILRRL